VRSLALTLLALLSFSSIAHAEPTESRWYGKKPLIADAVAFGMIGGGIAMIDAHAGSDATGLGGTLLFAGIGTYAVVAPVFESQAGHGTHAVGSVAARVFVPLVAGVAAFGATKSSGEAIDLKPFGNFATAALIAAGVTALVDDATCVETTPYVTPTRGGASIGIAGRF